MKKLISLFCLFSAVTIGYTQPAFVQSVLLENDTISAPGYFTLKWNQEAGATQYRIFRKELSASSWNAGPLAILDPDVTSWTDSSVQKGEVYEYRVQKLASGYTGYGYMTAGVNLDPVESPGRVLVLVTPDIAMNLDKGEIDQMTNDLQREGWDVTAITTAATDEPEDIKDRITGWYQMDPATSRGVILLGHIPVAYSGNLAPDGHPDHQGAWPADGYYGDMDGNWSDWQVNNTVANQTRHHNIPADGKFDQSTFPSPLELWVGRIDFANLPAFSESEVELTRQYLDKLHRFKNAQFRAIPRGVLEDNFGNFQEGFSQNGWKNFSTIVGMDNVKAMDYRSTLQADSYMFSYGCGGGNYRGASGISNTTNMAADSLQTIFTMLFGSYFGDWDSNDNFLRAALASGTTLTNMWAGRPHWQIHPMALGYTIGDCALLSMNNNGVYVTGFAGRGVQMALLGDPTLQWHYVKPPEMLEATETNHRIQLDWVASEDEVEGYHIYRKRSSESGFHRLSDQLVKTTSFIDSCLSAGQSYEYLVRAVDLIQSASGSYYRSSLGAMIQISPINDLGLLLDFSVNTEYEKLMISDQSANVETYRWTFGDGGSSSDPAPQYEYQKTDSLFDVEICLAAKNRCFEELSCRNLTVMGSLPRLENIESDPPKCAEDSTINWKATLVYSGAEPLVFSNQVMRNGLELFAELVNGKGIISVTNDLGDQLTYGPYQLAAPDPISGTYDIREPDDVLNSGMISISDISGGVPPYMILWNTGSTESVITGLEPGIFWVDITDGNGCTKRDSFELKRSTSTISQFIEGVRVFPNPFEDQLVFEDDLGRESVILLRDLTGRELYRWESKGATVMSLPVSDALSPGIYLVTVQIQGQEVTYKLTKAGRP